MISLLFKNWRFVVDILLILVAVILLFWWNPMGIFGGGLKLEDTANMVTEINEIGELVTAEYYGEVITSIDEARINPLKDDEIGERAAIIYADLLAALGNLKIYQANDVADRVEEYRKGERVNNWRRIIKHEVDSRNILDKLDYHGFLVELEAEPLFDDLLEFLWMERLSSEPNDSPKEREINQLLFQMYLELGSDSNFSDSWKTRFIQTYHSNIDEGLSRKDSRKKLTMIGRGWVKAGFDFSDLGEESIVYYEDLAEIHLIGINPKILNADINPWFIPEKGIPGFQILNEKGAVNFYDAKKVKQYCIDKLTVYAHQARILENAKRQGAETLQNLFSLLTGKEIKSVVFHDNPFIEFSKEVEKDEMVTYPEAYILDSLTRLEVKEINYLKSSIRNQSINKGFAAQKELILKQTLMRLQQYPYQDNGKPFNFFSKLSTDMALDSLIDDGEDSVLNAYRGMFNLTAFFEEDSLDRETDESLWYWMDEAYKYLNAYNEMIGTLFSNGVLRNDPDSILIDRGRFEDRSAFEDFEVVDFRSIPGKDSVRLYILTDSSSQGYFRRKLYPVSIRPDSLGSFLKRKEVLFDSFAKSGDGLPKAERGNVWFYDSEIDSLRIFRLAMDLHTWLPEILANEYDEKHFFKINDGMLFIQQSDSLSRVFSSDLQELSEDQSIEMEKFFRKLFLRREEEQNKNFLERSKDWVNDRTKGRKGTTVYLNPKGLQFK